MFTKTSVSGVFFHSKKTAPWRNRNKGPHYGDLPEKKESGRKKGEYTWHWNGLRRYRGRGIPIP